MKFGFVTCVELGLSCMQAIYDVGGHLDLAITLPDDRAVGKSGRVYLDTFCSEQSIPLLKSSNVNDQAVISAVGEHAIDWLFIIGWSQIAHAEILATPTRGVLGMHPTLLPEGRGRAAIPWAILKGLDRTGVTLFRMDEGVDTGEIIAQRVISMRPFIDAAELYAKVNEAHVDLMRELFPQLLVDRVKMVPQDHARATEWPGRKPEDGRIDPNGSVFEAERLVRAVTKPYPGAFLDTDNGRMIVWKAEIGDGSQMDDTDTPCIEFRDGILRCLQSEFVSAAH